MKKYELGDFEVNTYLLTNQNQCFVIDPGYYSKDLEEEVKKYKLLGILLTHGHLDHIDGIGEYNCPIYIHKNDLICLKDEKYSCYYMANKKRNFKYENLDIIVVEDQMEIDFNKEKIKVLHTPGHTQGSVCYLYKDKIFTGDTLFKQTVGRTDLPSGDSRKLKKSILNLMDEIEDFVKVYPGHGENSTIKFEKNNNEYYKLWSKK